MFIINLNMFMPASQTDWKYFQALIIVLSINNIISFITVQSYDVRK